MRDKRTTTVDGRATYKTGGTQTQPVYLRQGQEYARDSAGNPIVAKYRVRRYKYVTVNGKQVRTPKVSILVDKHPDDMDGAEARALNRALDELLDNQISQVEIFKTATEEVKAVEGFETELVRKVLARVTKAIGDDPLSEASLAAKKEFAGELQKYEDEANHSVSRIQEGIEKRELALAEKKKKEEQKIRSQTLTMACLAYIDDPDIRAGDETRRKYISTLRNHIMVPSAKGRKAIGDYPMDEINKKVLLDYEKSLYLERDGYEFAYTVRDEEGKKAFAQWVEEGTPFPTIDKRQPKLKPPSVHKALGMIGAVVQWAIQDAKTWGLENYHVNLIHGYKMQQKAGSKRKMFAPGVSDFDKYIKAAEDLDLGYMIPLMALVRCSFRPAEARGIRWSDISKKNLYGTVADAATLHGTIRFDTGKGERWVPEAKTEAALDDPVIIPSSILAILEKHRADGCEYVVPPKPNNGGKNSSRQVLPFLTRDAYAKGWAEIKAKLELDSKAELYDLKHGLIAELLQAGYKAETISLMTRHTTVEMINTVYGAINSGDLADAIDKLHQKKKDSSTAPSK